MSVSYYTFLGPYIEVYNPEKDIIKEYHTCLNVKCANHKKDISDGYCSKCGKRIERFSKNIKQSIELRWCDEFNDDELTEVMVEYKPHEKQDQLFFISNSKSLPSIMLDVNETTAMELDKPDPKSEIEKFTKLFDKSLKKLKDVFGKENVSVKWGLLVWCH